LISGQSSVVTTNAPTLYQNSHLLSRRSEVPQPWVEARSSPKMGRLIQVP
jgi:hypothetical protein